MTSPRQAHDTDNGRYYTCPTGHPEAGRELVSVTNALSVGMSKYGLPLWYARLATEAAWEQLPRMVAATLLPLCGKTGDDACRQCRDCLTRDIKAAAENARDRAANLGTRVHDLAEAHLTGRQMAAQEGDQQAWRFVNQYLEFLKEFEVDLAEHVEFAELTVANPRLGYAGTLDAGLLLPLDGFIPGMAVKRLPEGKRALWLLDYKTSETRAATQTYPEHTLQLTALRHCTEMWLPDGSVIPMVRGIKGTAVLNLRTGKYKLIPVPSRTQEMNAFKAILQQTAWLHGTWPGEYDHRPIKPTGAFEPKRGSKNTTTSGKAA